MENLNANLVSNVQNIVNFLFWSMIVIVFVKGCIDMVFGNNIENFESRSENFEISED